MIHQGVLSGIKVIELAHLIAGPYCGMLLADEGADVIKVEPPQGELTRSREPIRTTDQGTMSGYYASLNRRKKSIVLDLKNPEGASVFQKLLSDADIFVTNMRTRALRNLGLDPQRMLERYPSLIIVCMTGFGLIGGGEDADRAGLAMVAEALSGITSLTRDRSGRPVWCGFALGDIITGTTAHAAALLALRNRDQTGNGRLIDMALPDSTLPFATVALARVQAADEETNAYSGSNDFHGVPYGTFEAADGFYNLGVINDDFWARLCEGMGLPELAHDPRYEVFRERAKRQAEVHEIVENWSRGLSRADVVDRLTKADVPVAPILSLVEVAHSTYLHRRGAFVEVEDGIGHILFQPLQTSRTAHHGNR